jgi:hypothetical protein
VSCTSCQIGIRLENRSILNEAISAAEGQIHGIWGVAGLPILHETRWVGRPSRRSAARRAVGVQSGAGSVTVRDGLWRSVAYHFVLERESTDRISCEVELRQADFTGGILPPKLAKEARDAGIISDVTWLNLAVLGEPEVLTMRTWKWTCFDDLSTCTFAPLQYHGLIISSCHDRHRRWIITKKIPS